MSKWKPIVAAVAGGMVGALGVMPFVGGGRPASASEEDGAASVVAATPEAAGRHLVRIGGCNDCHTPGFMQQGEAVPESQWLIGVPLGFKGPWGTTYAPNLRTKAFALSEAQWTTFVKNHTGRPPMPWTATHAMSDADRRNLYLYLRSLGPSDNAVPDGLDPGQTPATPYLVFEPVMPTAAAE
jgi:mono/diheme cytochrome c family protein